MNKRQKIFVLCFFLAIMTMIIVVIANCLETEPEFDRYSTGIVFPPKEPVAVYIPVSQMTPQQIFAELEKYGVHWQILDAIWSIESDRGKYPSQYRIIDRLSGKTLEIFYDICAKAGHSPEKMFGGSAGEMGNFQFKVRAWKRFQIDFNCNRICNPWEFSDAAASCCNFLLALGYKKNPFEAVMKYNNGPNRIGYTLEVFEEAIRNGASFELKEVKKALGITQLSASLFCLNSIKI